MRKIWLISDTHFNHANILKFESNGVRVRPEFDTVEQMNECMLDNWNETVRNGDIIYHLGDVHFSNTCPDLSKLPGKKRLLLGNHDHGKSKILNEYFSKIEMWRMFPEYDILLSHVPVHESSLYKTKFNVHGHIHEKPDVGKWWHNISVERTGYKPVDIEEISAKMKTRIQ